MRFSVVVAATTDRCVYLRRSPLNDREKSEGETPIVTVAPATSEITLVTNVKRTKTYTFDKVLLAALCFAKRAAHTRCSNV